MVHNIAEVVRQFKHQWTHQLEDKAVEQICQEEGMTWRKRLLTPLMTIRVFLLQILHGNTACTDMRHVAQMAFTGAAYCQARMRIPLSVFQRLLQRTAAHEGRDI